MLTHALSYAEPYPIRDIDFKEIELLPLEHAGARDPEYRLRRNYIADMARQYRQNPQRGVPSVEYTEQEHAVWQHVYRHLAEIHPRRACKLYLEAKRQLGISPIRIPQLSELSEKLTQAADFRLAPIEGLVETRAFLSWLGTRTMLSTQYVRHHSRPEYTPEPDIIHEAIGHVPMFMIRDFADFSQFIGRGAMVANDVQLAQLGSLYWYTVEFGLVEEDGEIKAFGAGLLSSFGELEHAFSDDVERRKFDLEEVINRPFSYSEMQPTLYVIPSYVYLKELTRQFIESF
jgi:phenylalanine-4-hydroxylase